MFDTEHLACAWVRRVGLSSADEPDRGVVLNSGSINAMVPLGGLPTSQPAPRLAAAQGALREVLVHRLPADSELSGQGRLGTPSPARRRCAPRVVDAPGSAFEPTRSTSQR